MKKIFTLLTASTLSLAANSQVYFSDDFEGGSLTANEAWTVQSILNPDGLDEWVHGSPNGNFAKCSNHTFNPHQDHDLNSWLISPSMNLSSGTDVEMTFDNVTRYGTTNMKVQISTTYDGTSDPSTQGAWTDITSLFTLDTDDNSWSFVSAGTGNITSYISANTFIAFEFIGTTTDGPTWEVDNVRIQEVGTIPPAPTVTSIYDIQYTTNASGDSPELDNILTTRGVVTGVYQIGSNADRFFIQDGDGAWNGIYVYENGTTVNVGDSVLVTGKVLEFNGLTEIGSVTNITIINSGNAQPTPVVVTSSTVGNEEYEGVLVKVENGINTVAPDQYGAWIINDGGDVIIDDDLMAPYTPVFGNGYDVTGVRHLSFGDILVLPRNAVSDIVTVGFASINENELELSVYPNPANENVTISGVENGNVTIFAVNGAVVYNGVVNGATTINVNDFTSGFYTVEVVENGLKANYKLMVK